MAMNGRQRIVVEARVRETLHEVIPDVRLSPEALDLLDSAVRDLLKDAAKRAKGNGRVTIQPQDF